MRASPPHRGCSAPSCALVQQDWADAGSHHAACPHGLGCEPPFPQLPPKRFCSEKNAKDVPCGHSTSAAVVAAGVSGVLLHVRTCARWQHDPSLAHPCHPPVPCRRRTAGAGRVLPVHPAKVPQGGKHLDCSHPAALGIFLTQPVLSWPDSARSPFIRLHLLQCQPLLPRPTPLASHLSSQSPQGLMADLRAYCITDVSASMERTRWAAGRPLAASCAQLCACHASCALGPACMCPICSTPISSSQGCDASSTCCPHCSMRWQSHSGPPPALPTCLRLSPLVLPRAFHLLAACCSRTRLWTASRPATAPSCASLRRRRCLRCTPTRCWAEQLVLRCLTPATAVLCWQRHPVRGGGGLRWMTI